MSRVVERIRRIGPHPVLLGRYAAHHTLTRAGQRRLRRAYSSRVATPPPGATLRLPLVELGIATDLPAALRDGAERIRIEADAILRHELDILGSGPHTLGEALDWHVDFKSGYRWPRDFYQDVRVTRLDDSSDAKVPWELSRAHHLVTLARAAVLWGDDRYAEELEQQLAHWLAENPIGFGINWVNPMEAAIRAVNWIWALATLGPHRALPRELERELTRSLQAHGRHIAANLEGSPWLRSNHYLADVLGLAALGACIRDDPAAARWLAFARRAFEREIRTQVLADGLAFEASLPYHGLVLEMFVLGRRLCRLGGRPLSHDFDERLEAMLLAVRSVRHPDGRLPQFGDGDSGRILPAGCARPPTADPLLWLGAAELERGAPFDGVPHEEVAWTLGTASWRGMLAVPVDAAPSRTSFPFGGVAVVGDGRLRCVVRCGEVGQNDNGGHAHNDAGSFELSSGGITLVVDPGTYAYTADPDARNAFRGTAFHNTVMVGGAEIHPIDPVRLFELAPSCSPRIVGASVNRAVVEHDGYRRLEVPTVHRRTFVAHDDVLRIEDVLDGDGPQKAAVHVHVAPRASIEPVLDRTFRIACDGVALEVSFTDVDRVEVADGWVSESFGRREPASVIVAHVAGRLPLRFACTFAVVAVGT